LLERDVCARVANREDAEQQAGRDERQPDPERESRAA